MGRYAVMKELGGEVIVQNPSPAIEKIMLLAGMERVVKIEGASVSHNAAKSTVRRRRKSNATAKREVSGK
jgi:anti-anti-sigma regulatory factor